MSSEDMVIGTSFISLVTTKQEVFDAAAKFYEQLGFRLVKAYTKGLSIGMEGLGRANYGVAAGSSKEIWIESFPLQDVDKNDCVVPWQELSIYDGDNCEKINNSTLLKIRLTSDDEFSTTATDLRFFSTELEKIQSILENKLKVDVNSDGDSISTVDPMGNILFFSSKQTPLSKKEYKTSDGYIKDRYEEIKNKTEKNKSLLHETSEESASSAPKKKIGVMTSGGDAPGMNAVVRAVVRAGIYFNCDVFAVYEGYRGLVEGGKLLRKMEWGDVKSYLSMGGTNIGTARCMEFREREGRLQACYNMVINGIDALIVCGGDGSLTGADLFRSEWPSLLEELISTGRLNKSQADPYRNLCIVGLVGSIDNDMSSTDTTIGAYSSLERITEMVDYIDETAASHSRAFVVEVMGRHCGWLGLMSGLATGADFIFIPERPPKAGKWHDELKDVCHRHRELGKRNTTVIVAEGAIDDELNPITAEDVKNVLVDLGLDTRITTLGHVQRGGSAVAFDRALGTLQGVEAVKAVMEMTPDDPSPMISIFQNHIVRKPLVEAVQLTKSVAAAIESKDFDKAMSLRDSTFAEAYEHFLQITLHADGSSKLPEDRRLNIGVVHVGASSAALNSCTRAMALYCLAKGHKLLAIENGFSGLIESGIMSEITWKEVDGWHNRGGSEIGTNRSLPSQNFGRIAYEFQRYKLDGLIIIGGFESFTALHELYENRDKYPIFDIPSVVIPATVSNNVPGTEYSLGTDTCLNQLVNYCDTVKQSASSSRRRVFVVEVQGGHSGFVAASAGLITGSIATYTPEKSIDLNTIQEDINLLFKVFQDDRGEDRNGKIIIRNEQSSSVYTTELIADIIKESANGRFETRTAIPGHVQQGFTPSSMDRVNAVMFGARACQFIEDNNTKLRNLISDMDVTYAHKRAGLSRDAISIESERYLSYKSAVVIGIQGAHVTYSPISDLYDNEANVALRKGKTIHWSKLTEISDILSGRLMLRKLSK